MKTYIEGTGGLKTDKEGLNLIITYTKLVYPDLVLIELDTNHLAAEAFDKAKQATQILNNLSHTSCSSKQLMCNHNNCYKTVHL